MPIPGDTEEEVCAQIGILLLLVQDFEMLLNFAIKVALRERSEVTIESLTKEDKRTMGQFVRQVRSDAALSEDVDALLDRVLDGRNLLVHNLRQQPWFDMRTTIGRDKIWEFIETFQPNLEEALMVFTAFAMDYGKKIAFPADYEKIPWVGDFYERLKHVYMPTIEQRVRKKT